VSKTALVATCLREAAAIDEFLAALLGQTRKPDSIVILDAGSGDGTVERIQVAIASGAPVTLIVQPGANRSVGRNRAIEAADADLIAVTDVGSLPQPEWFSRIISPLESAPDVGVVAGYYEPTPQSTWDAAVAAATVPAVSEVNPKTFLPSSRSVAFRRSAWEAAGGYPERAWHNEDTPFDLAMKAAGARFVFEPQAVVHWRPHSSLRRLYRQFARYARGDAEEGIWFSHYTKAYLVATATLGALWLGLLWPPYFWWLPLLAAAYWARHALRARRRTNSWPAAALAPIVNATLDIAHVVGYTTGLIRRRPDAD